MDCTRLLVPGTGVPLLTMALSKLHSARLSVPVVGDKPHHPIDSAFPPENLVRRIQLSVAFKLDGLNSGSGSITMKRMILLAASIA